MLAPPVAAASPQDGKCGETLDGTGSIAGIVTERDYLRKMAVEGRKSETTKVKDIMTTKLITLSPSTQVLDALALMTEKRIRHIPVIDKDHMYGVVSINDVVRVVVKESKAQISETIAYLNSSHS